MECDTVIAARIHYSTICFKGWICDPTCAECIRIREQDKTTVWKKPHTCNWVNIRPARNVKPQMPAIMPEQVDIQHVADLLPFWEEEKIMQISDLEKFHQFHAAEQEVMMERLSEAALNNGNLFEVLMDAAEVCSLGQITQQLYQLGGQYRRNM